MRRHLAPMTVMPGLLAAVTLACGDAATAANPVAPTQTTATATPPAEPEPTPSEPAPGPTGPTFPGMYSQFGGSVTVTRDGNFVVLRTTDLPDHPSPYWGNGHMLYEMPHDGMRPNPHRIASQNVTLRVPLSPVVGNPSDTPLGPIGVAVNGVVFFNQYAAGRQPLTNEIVSFDRLNGHPAPSNMYHYHFEPLWLTSQSRSRLIGVLLDGFPVYGPADSGGAVPASLDTCNGHTGRTPEFPEGIYHYHTTPVVPYISGCYRGTPGTIG